MCTSLGDELGEDDQADQHGDVGQQGEDGQDAEVSNEDQQQQEGQEGEHVEPRVHGGRQDHCLIVVAVVGGPVGCFYHLEPGQARRRKSY